MNINVGVILENYIIIVLLPLAIISLVLYFPSYQRRSRIGFSVVFAIL